jgi:hypothetical protein
VNYPSLVAAWIAYLVHAIAAIAAVGLVVARRRGGDAWVLRVFEIATAVGVACALLALTSGPVLIDFEKAYLYAGRTVLTEPSKLYECTRGQCFVNIPIVALLFVPFALLNPTVAGILFSVAGGLLLVAGVRRMARGTAADVIAWTAILSGPIY